MKRFKIILRRIAFYALSWTWGFIMSFIGMWPTLVFAIAGKTKFYHGRIYSVVGHNWGGVALGCFFIVCEESAQDDHVRGHECGHGLQNCIWGPLMPFVICIPSGVRYQYFNFYRRKYRKNPEPYDKIWFEHQATEWGQKFINTDVL